MIIRSILIVLIGIIGGYLIAIGAFNDWYFLSDIEPKEFAKRLFMVSWFGCLCSFLAWCVFIGLFEWYDL